MHPDCLQHSLTSQEAENFERDGYLIVPNALTTAQVDNYIALVDQLALDRVEETEADGRLHMRDFLRRDQAFLDLLDWPTTFPKMWGLMGWHLQLYLSHIDVTPPLTSVAGGEALAAQLPADGSVGRLGWHQDSGRVNMELETNPRPRLSTKIGYFLTDTTQPGYGNLWVVPGSHLDNDLTMPDDPEANPENAIPICVPAGTAVFFDRRVWHSRSPNLSDQVRKVMFYGYSYRWLRPRDNLNINDYPDCHDLIKRQLLGAVRDGHGYSTPEPDDVPLQSWLVEQLGEAAVPP